MSIGIVDFPIENGGSFHSSVNIYQMVCPIIAQEMASRYWMVGLPIQHCHYVNVYQKVYLMIIIQ